MMRLITSYLKSGDVHVSMPHSVGTTKIKYPQPIPGFQSDMLSSEYDSLHFKGLGPCTSYSSRWSKEKYQITDWISGFCHCAFFAFSSASTLSVASSFMATITYAMSTTFAINAAVAPANVEFPVFCKVAPF